MTEQLLHGADIVTILKKMRGEGMAESVGRGELGQAGIAHGLLHRALHALFIQMMAARFVRTWVDRQIL